MRRILIGTPCRDGLDVNYVTGLMAILMTKLPKGCDYEFVPSLSKATYVNTARNVLADEAVDQGCSEIVFVDADVGLETEHFGRLLSHDVDIVGADYAKRVAGEPQWTARAVPGSKPNEAGLQPCTCLPGGFLRIRTSVFKRMFELLPQRHYQHEGKPVRCEYFPIGLTEKNGWRHPAEVRLDKVRVALGARNLDRKDFYERMCSALFDPLDAAPEIVGEDVSFCRLAIQCGFTVWCDLGIKLRHYGNIGFPASLTPF